MNRTQLIAHLAAKGILTEAALNTLKDEQLHALAQSSGVAATNTQANPDESTDLAILQSRNLELRRENERLQRETQSAVANERAERARLEEDLLYIENRAITDAEIRAMDMPTLRKWHTTLCARPVDYSGRGGPRGQSAAVSFAPRGIMLGANEALDSVANTPAGARD